MKKRFYEKYKQRGLLFNKQILVDKETGVNYLCLNMGAYGGLGVTPLLDRQGKPIITNEDIE